MQSWRRLTMSALCVLSSLALGTGVTQPFSGTARPVKPPAACRDTLGQPPRTANGYIYSPLLQLPSSLRLRSCWTGHLHGQAFTLLGYSDADNDSAVLVRSSHHQTLLPVSNGTPTVTSFTGNVVCYIPNLAKGVAYPVDIVHQRLLSDPDARCRPIQAARATTVSGLNQVYRIGADGSFTTGHSGR